MIDAQSAFPVPEIESAISKANLSYHKLLVLAGKSGTGKTPLLRQISNNQGIPIINLGLTLSRQLLSLTIRQRKLKAADMIEDILGEPDSPRVGVDNTEIIFEPSLKLNALGLLRNISRNRLVIWAWNGEAEGDLLTYGYPGHPEYQRISAREFTVIAL
jgi:hypothetical protein